MKTLILILSICFASSAVADEVVMFTTGNCIYCDQWVKYDKPHVANAREFKLRKYPTFVLVVDGQVKIIEGYQPHGVLRGLMAAMRRAPEIIPVPVPDPVAN